MDIFSQFDGCIRFDNAKEETLAVDIWLFVAQLKGTDHDFCWSGKPIYHLQKQGNIHIFQNKYQNPHKFAEIMKKNRVFGKFHS